MQGERDMAVNAWSYASGTSDVPLLGLTIGDIFDRTASRYADNEALVSRHQNLRYTYRQLRHEVDRCARALMAVGVEKGQRVGIWAPNCAEWTITQIATAKLGSILVNINPSYRTHELAYVLNQSGIRMLVSSTSFKTSDYRAMVEEVLPDCPTVERTVFLGTRDWDDLVADGANLGDDVIADATADLAPNDPINIQYTSGTTGFPKGATLSHRNILNNGYFTTERINFTENDRLAIPVPFYHCFGMVMGNLGCISHGACMVIPAPGFDPAQTLAAIQDERCSGVYGVPTMFIAMQNAADFSSYDVSSLRTGIMAGSPCPIEVMKRCINDMHMEEVSIAYGMTETS